MMIKEDEGERFFDLRQEKIGDIMIIPASDEGNAALTPFLQAALNLVKRNGLAIAISL
jgi:hypothetical protein